MLRDLHWLRSPERIDFKLAVSLTDASTVWRHGIFPITSRASPIPTAAVSGRRHPRSVGDRAFPVAGCRLWNSLLPDVTSASTLTVFRNLLKTYLFS